MNKRLEVYKKFNGRCAYCGKHIKIKEMQIDHQKAVCNGGSNDIENLFPACRRCNHYKRAKDLEGFRIYIKTLHERLRNNYIVKVAEDYGIIKVEPFNGEFHFEKRNENKEIARVENTIKFDNQRAIIILKNEKGLITENPKTNVELLLNRVYVKDNEVWLKGLGSGKDISLVDYCNNEHEQTYGCKIEETDPVEFGECLFGSGDMIEMFYFLATGFAEVRAKLKFLIESVEGEG